ncbi:MAG: ATP-binding protein [Deltaproteobacteria bacterium]|nr:ATP-binding protein [Deltaproteobacteria bacterium]MBI3293410.1 ATP-binding protein [Deltaproteobacteria bacterium]
MSHTRYLRPFVQKDLEEKIVLVGGPRQVGKTTLALTFLNPSSKKNPAYLNWDASADRPLIRKAEFPPGVELIVLDEIHKYAKWRGLLKGLFDKRVPDLKFLVTGSARLDHYKRGGESLFGRHTSFRLHPFSLGELNGTQKDLESLLRFSGFPEPFFRQDSTRLRLWRRARNSLIIGDDLRDLERVHELSQIEALLELLPPRVGSPISIKGIREDLDTSHHSVERWIKILENLYFCFRIPPYGSPKVRAVKKEQKLYLWEWTEIEDPGIRFENLVACQLLKYVHFKEDTEGFRMELRYLRDTDKREVDFVVLQEGKPLFAVEAKLNEENMAPALHYFKERTPVPFFYQVHGRTRDYQPDFRIRVCPFPTFCKDLKMP